MSVPAVERALPVDRFEHPHSRLSRHVRQRPVRRPLDLVSMLGASVVVSNIIMQLANPKVGWGVHESRVDSGSAFVHPVKRARTTGTFLAVALMGDERDVELVRAEVARIHDEVVSTPSSPVRYSANDARLQLWVAVCLLKFFLDQYELLYGPLSPADKEMVVAQCHGLGTTLNVPAELWPSSYAEVVAYWDGELPTLSIDPAVRDKLLTLADLSFLIGPMGPVGWLLHKTLGRSASHLFRAGLPAEFRALMGWSWSERDDRWYSRVIRVTRVLDRAFHPVVRSIYRLYLADLRIRRRLGLRVF